MIINKDDETGFYIIVKGHPKSSEMYPILLEAFEYMAGYEGDVPGASPENCGKYLMHDLPMAKWEAGKYVEYLKSADKSVIFTYPSAERLTLGDGQEFFDS